MSFKSVLSLALLASALGLSPSFTCEHAETCSGCVTTDSLTSVPIFSSARKYFTSPTTLPHTRSSFQFDTDIPTEPTGWRTQAKLAVAPIHPFLPGCEFGLYSRGSHNVVPITNCAVHHPSINIALDSLRRATKKAGVTAYTSGPPPKGLLRYVQLQVDRTTSKIGLTLIFNSPTPKGTQPHLSRLVKALKKDSPDLWHSIWVHANDSGGNVIFQRGQQKWDRVYGPEYMVDGYMYFNPLVFRQGNLDGFERIAEAVVDEVRSHGGNRICELYSGVGVLGLRVWRDAGVEWVRCSDENPHNLKCFNKGKRAVDAGDAVTYMTASAGDAVMAGEGDSCDTLIVDPPRSGLDDVVTESLCMKRGEGPLGDVKTLVYVSCGFDALARDLDKIFKDGKGSWTVERATGYLLFPGTNHVETLVVLTRGGGGGKSGRR